MAAPSTSPARVGEVRFIKETVGSANAAIATPSTFWAASPKKVKAWDIKSGNTRDAEDDPSMVLHAMEDRQRLLLAKKAAMGFKCWFTGLTPTTPAQDDLGLLLAGALGGESLGPASTTITGANAGAGATAPLAVTLGTGILAGQAIKVVSATRTEIRRVVSVAANNITLDQDLAGVYTSGTVLASATYYPLTGPLTDLNDAGHFTFATLFRGANAAEQLQSRGVFFGIEIADVGVNKRPKFDVSCQGQDWDYVSGVAALSPFTEPAAPNQVNNGLYLNAQGTVTNNIVPVSEIDIKLGMTVEPQMSPNGENGVIGHLAFGFRTTIEFTTYFAVSTWGDAFEAGTKFVGGYVLGNNGLISFPQLTIDEYPEAVGAGAQPRGVKVKMHADNGPVVTNDLTLAKFALHRFGGT